jgi:predicted nicotinamide N-methyase
LIYVSKILAPFYNGQVSYENVGLQTWRASLLLSEYLMDIAEEIKGRKILELGAGSAIPSIIASQWAKVTATDLPVISLHY